MEKIDLIDTRVMRTFATEISLPDAITQLVRRAIDKGVDPHIIQVQCSTDYLSTGEYEIILWGD